jgi:hypothetical protein
VQKSAAYEISKPVIGQDVEERHDFIDVLADPSPRILWRHPMLGSMGGNGCGDFIVCEQGLANSPLRGKLETIDMRASLPEGSERALVQSSPKKVESHE